MVFQDKLKMEKVRGGSAGPVGGGGGPAKGGVGATGGSGGGPSSRGQQGGGHSGEVERDQKKVTVQVGPGEPGKTKYKETGSSRHRQRVPSATLVRIE